MENVVTVYAAKPTASMKGTVLQKQFKKSNVGDNVIEFHKNLVYGLSLKKMFEESFSTSSNICLLQKFLSN